MGFFDRIMRGNKSKQEIINNKTQGQPIPVAKNVELPKSPNLEEGYDYKNLFSYALTLGTTLQNMGIDNIDFETFLLKENIEEEINDDTHQYIRVKQNDLTISCTLTKDVITVKIDKSSNGLEGKRVTLTFDKETYVEIKRVIQDYISENDKTQAINAIAIERTKGRIEQVKYTHIVKQTWQDRQDINESIDNVYRQIPGGSEIVKTPEEIAEFEMRTGLDWCVGDTYYPSYLENTVLMKQIDLSNVSGDISSLESLHGLDDSEISKLAGVRDSNAEEKSSRISLKILRSHRCLQYLRNMLYPTVPGIIMLRNVFSDGEIVDEYRNIIKRDFEKDREKSDKQNQSTDIYNAKGTPITIYTKDGTPITKSYIAQLIENKKAHDEWCKKQWEENSKDYGVYNEFD